MNNLLKKLGYLITVSISLFILYGVCMMTYRNFIPATPNHDNLTLTPFTPNERISLEMAQREAELKIHPMIILNSPQVSADIAQKRVLNATSMHGQ